LKREARHSTARQESEGRGRAVRVWCMDATDEGHTQPCSHPTRMSQSVSQSLRQWVVSQSVSQSVRQTDRQRLSEQVSQSE
jgi:hypothetical protein